MLMTYTKTYQNDIQGEIIMNEEKNVLVTGGTGYIAEYIIANLLDRGYNVRATARSTKRVSSAQAAIKNLTQSEHPEIEFVAADLASDSGWKAAMKGMNYVMHVASPFPVTSPKNDDEVIRPAVDGALRVLKAADAAGVKRVVMTSAFGAVAMGYPTSHNNHVYTEKDWSNIAPDSKISAYYKSKTLAEQAAWNYVNQPDVKMELATILPVAVFGPVVAGQRISGSNSLIDMLTGTRIPIAMNLTFPIIDVRDLTKLHIMALENPNGAGNRFIASHNDSIAMADVQRILRSNIPSLKTRLPIIKIPDWTLKAMAPFNKTMRDNSADLGVIRLMSNHHAKDVLDWEPKYSEKESIIDTANSILKLKQK